MTTPDQEELVQKVVDRLLGYPSRNALAFPIAALDTSRTNIHDNKTEFQAELKIVQETIDNLIAAYIRLAGPDDGDSVQRKAMLKRLRASVDQNVRNRLARAKPKSALELIRKNIADVGLYYNSIWMLYELSISLDERLAELIAQRKEFWSVSNRPPNYYARTIAQRLARLYAREKGKRPTFGTARDGGHPSTDYGRALEEIFGIIGVRANVRRAAEWAINELSESDLKPHRMGSTRTPRGIINRPSKAPKP